MILHCYTSTHNDLYMLRYYVRHWKRYAEKIFVYDDESTDGTIEFLQSQAPLVEIMSPGFSGIDELKLQAMRNREYKEHSRGMADWCVIGDCDEMHYHPNFVEKLTVLKEAGYSAVISHGFNMFATSPPTGNGQMMSYVKNGIQDGFYNRVIFRPEIDIIIGIGHHGYAIPDKTVKIVDFDMDFKMLHFKFLGRQYIEDRYARNWSRTSQENKEHGWGIHSSPGWKSSYGLDWYDRMLEAAKPCLD